MATTVLRFIKNCLELSQLDDVAIAELNLFERDELVFGSRFEWVFRRFNRGVRLAVQSSFAAVVLQYVFQRSQRVDQHQCPTGGHRDPGIHIQVELDMQGAVEADECRGREQQQAGCRGGRGGSNRHGCSCLYPSMFDNRVRAGVYNWLIYPSG